MFYKFAKAVVYTVFKFLFRIKIFGKENVPKEGPVIICSNHISNYDPPVVGITCPRDINFMAKEELFEKKGIGFLLRNLQAFPVKRGMRDRNALRNGLGLLEDGGTLGLFPEGTRSKDGQLKKGLAGAGFFAMRSNATVIPCAIIGTYERFKPLKVIYGPPIEFETLKEDKPSAQEVTDEIMENIQSLIDENKK
ncbi:lysophospholipid acyltransferase family protein [Alkalibacillus haloalkaliphilus]|uniref:lysophospholipid acyltransferase family protein n=1 Tax=Alkalibacillus haloalkaliphilus TaxID=94136 RepID=UPI002935AD7F|nr:lysophospholipid acyltransferase family protein [Alkalibacillus haloalkaliphilus]MDV2580840.1 lysophospholipid acyltransferase family protein [Alkalibacillus haloalkaliphilus]